MKSVRFFLSVLAFVFPYGSEVYSQVPALNSFPSASATVYLDFDGEFITGTSWNWNGPIDAREAGFSAPEITEIYRRVSEDFRPFNLNITTDSNVYLAAPFNQRTRLIVTATSAWYGSAGGVSYVGSFTWGDETPAWVFSSLLQKNVKYVAEACSHEIGHTMGLQHQSTYNGSCNKIAEYNKGQGEGETGWAPIMGVGYYKNLTTWHVGTSSAGCSNIQDDLQIIAGKSNGFGLRQDDHGNAVSTATAIPIVGQNFIVHGLINKPQDTDEFKLELNGTGRIRLTATPENVGIGNLGADLDMKLALINSNADTISIFNPPDVLGVSIDTILDSGIYYLAVLPAANANHFADGSLGYYALAGSLAIALPVHNFLLKFKKSYSGSLLNWTFNSDERLKQMVVESSIDGKSFREISVLGSGEKNYLINEAAFTGFYRLKAIPESGNRPYYSNIIDSWKNTETMPFRLMTNIVRDRVLIKSAYAWVFQVFDTGGQLLLKGKLVPGLNEVEISKTRPGLLYIQVGDGVNSRTEKIIKQ